MNVDFLLKTMMFRGMDRSEAEQALTALRAKEKNYKKGELILHAGTLTRSICLVLSGSVTIESNDLWGNRSILSLAEPGEFFAETYAMLPDEPLLVDVTANEDSRILFLHTEGLLDAAIDSPWHVKLLRNILLISTRKNLMLSRRAFHTSPKTARGRIMAYLNSVSLKKQSKDFFIPFDRQQMADYLNLDRTALSKELSRMAAEGIIKYRKNHFTIL